MSLVHVSFFSNILQKCVQMNVVIPDKGGGPFPVYYLLHGLSDDYSIWQRRTSIERHVEGLPLIVVMPDGYRGFYTDAHEGPAYGTYLMQDVIGYTDRVFPTIAKRSGRCIGGLSMGGYGALRLALAHPGMFVSANSHSGACQAGHKVDAILKDPEFRRVFGPSPRGSQHDLYALAAKLKRERTRVPRLRIDCGAEDFLIHDNRKFHGHLVRLGIQHEYAEYPGGHDWGYWDLHVREALTFHCRALGI